MFVSILSTTLIYVLTFYISCKMEDLACCALRILGLVMDLCCPLCIQIRGSFFPCVLCNSHVYCEHIVPVSILKHVHTWHVININLRSVILTSLRRESYHAAGRTVVVPLPSLESTDVPSSLVGRLLPALVFLRKSMGDLLDYVPPACRWQQCPGFFPYIPS